MLCAPMAARTDPDPEPSAKAELVPFTEGDFHALSPALARDPQFNDRRLEARRKLSSLAKVFAARSKQEGGPAFDVRTSLHAPHAFNHGQVKRLWAYATRDKKEKSRLRQTLGAELGKDLDSAYRNAYVCAAIEADALEVSLRFHADAWFDAQNAVHRAKAEGVAAWRGELDRLTGFRLRLADWKGEWVCGALQPEELERFLKYFKPGEHALAVERRFPAPPGARGEALSAGMPERLVAEMLRVVPLYRWMAWSKESDFLFRK